MGRIGRGQYGGHLKGVISDQNSVDSAQCLGDVGTKVGTKVTARGKRHHVSAKCQSAL